MSANNNVSLLGRLTKDPVQFTNGARFTVAINRNYKNKETGNYDADFIPCVVFGKRAETLLTYFKKGSRISLSGGIRTGSYDKDGTTVYTTDVVVESFAFVDPAAAQAAPAQAAPAQAAPAQAAPAQAAPAQAAPTQAAPAQAVPAQAAPTQAAPAQAVPAQAAPDINADFDFNTLLDEGMEDGLPFM